MKKLLFIISIVSSIIVFGQNQPPVAVDDSASAVFGSLITVNVTDNDYDPDGDDIKVVLAEFALSFSDSTITYYIEDAHFFPDTGFISLNYKIEDENGASGIESEGTVCLYIENYSYEFLDINNIRARFNAYGNHFWNFEFPFYEFPKDSGKHTIYNFAFWLGGMDENDQLRFAGERYRQLGIDYWTGPLTTDGNAWIDTTIASQWNKAWKLDKDEVVYHIFHWSDPGYEPPENILEWPAHGDLQLGQSFYLAPFIDTNGDSIYEPMQGDYPLIRGDQTIFFIFNDQKLHTESGGEPIGVEIHGFAYAFEALDNPQLHNTTFLSYKIFNRSLHTLTETYAGLFTDIDLGYAWDDFIGCDVARGAYYAYNGDTIDGNGEPEAYGANPPAQGIIVLGGPYMDPDGIDNPTGGCDVSINGVGFGDSIADNERYGMNNFIYFNNTGGPTGDPQTAFQYYNYLKGIWKDSTVMEYGGNGHVSSGAYGPACNFMFPGLTDPCNWGTNGIPPYGPVDWTEETAGNIPFDRRGLCSMGPFTLEPGGFHKIDIAFVTARGDSLINSVDLLMSYIDSVKTYYFQDPDHFGYAWLGSEENILIKSELNIYPNPATSNITLNYSPQTSNAQYMIYNCYGRQVDHGRMPMNLSHNINIRNLEMGMYILKIIDGNTVVSQKFIKR
ncbi:MAG: T9SS type A sorting domain-containing protein [Bacteroidales bacterium]|nr:T9SS type A sorting domain-containing protein [Bacteroidales bacterium]